MPFEVPPFREARPRIEGTEIVRSMTASYPPANPPLRVDPLPATLIELIPVALLHLGQGRKCT